MSHKDNTKIYHDNMYSVPDDVVFAARDELNRKVIAENLYRLLSSHFPSPYLLDGTWGIGKTEFCYKLINFIKDKNYSSKEGDKIFIPIYINVFSAERINNPFLVMMAAIQGTIQESIYLEEKNRHWLKKLIQKGGRIANKEISLQSLAPAITKDIVKFGLGTDLEPIFKLLSHMGSSDSVKELSRQLKAPAKKDIFVKSLESIYELDKDYQEFQLALSEFATNSNPLVFVIDELDRSQPDFAIKFLEKIKYLFDVPNVYFIFSCDSSQLLSTINHSYGYNLEAETYLEKFFASKCYLTINDNLALDVNLINTLMDELKKNREINKEDLIGVARILQAMCSIYSIRRLEKTINFIIALGSGRFESLFVSLKSGERDYHDAEISLKFYCLLTLIDIFLYHSIDTAKILQGALDDKEFYEIIDRSIFNKILNLHDGYILQRKIGANLVIPKEVRKFLYNKDKTINIMRYFNSFGEIKILNSL